MTQYNIYCMFLFIQYQAQHTRTNYYLIGPKEQWNNRRLFDCCLLVFVEKTKTITSFCFLVLLLQILTFYIVTIWLFAFIYIVFANCIRKSRKTKKKVIFTSNLGHDPIKTKDSKKDWLYFFFFSFSGNINISIHLSINP